MSLLYHRFEQFALAGLDTKVHLIPGNSGTGGSSKLAASTHTGTAKQIPQRDNMHNVETKLSKQRTVPPDQG